ncbi:MULTISPECIES: hypothetical protein [unclassified Kitasatospora]
MTTLLSRWQQPSPGHARDEELFRALLPPLTADVLGYYLPY